MSDIIALIQTFSVEFTWVKESGLKICNSPFDLLKYIIEDMKNILKDMKNIIKYGIYYENIKFNG